MSNFQSYSKYYDLLYADKDYSTESNYVTNLIRNYAPQAKRLLELGCGSGAHAYYFSKQNFEVFGVERSEEMVQQAHAKNIPNFLPVVADIESFNFEDQHFDVALSLFHVISYITDNETLLKSLQNINKHLTATGIFIFDVWYTPAVYHQKPETRIKRLANEEIEITRLAESEIDFNRNIVNVNYEILIREKENNQTQVIKELHPMRHFSIPEIELLAKLANFELVATEEFMTSNKPSENSWGVCFILRKIK